MPLSIKYTVFGRVQGVFFRVFTQEVAQGLGVRGYVRNEPDGTVTGVAQGDEDALTKFKEELWKGPKNADVVDVKISDEGQVGEFGYADFEVVRKKKK